MWTGKKRPTNDAYLAPRPQVGDLKVSLHESGECRIGPTGALRPRLARADRYATSVWNIPPDGPSPRALVSLQFHRSELIEAGGRGANVESILLPAGAESLMMLVLIGKPCDIVPGDDVRIDTLDRASDEQLLIVSTPCPPAAELLNEARRAIAGGEMASWRLPVSWPDSPLGWAVTSDWNADPERVNPPVLLELNLGTDAPVAFPDLHGLPIQVRPWDEHVGGPFDDPGICALLVAPGPTEPGEPSLFLNAHARCDHRSLGGTAMAVLKRFSSDGPDAGWSRIEGTDLWVTALATRDEASRR